MPLTPFDVDKYRKAQPVKTREGLVINNLKEMYIPEIATTYLTAVIAGKPMVWDITGKRDYLFDTPDPYDLFMDTPIVYKWAVTATMVDTDPVSASYTQVQIVELP